MADDDSLRDEQSSVRQWRKFRETRFHPSKVKRNLSKAEMRTTKHAQRFIVRRMDNLREASQRIVLWSMLVGVIIAGVGAQLFLFSTTYTTQATERGGTYSEGLMGSIMTLNPLYASSAPEVATSKLLFSSLYRYDQTGHLSPDAATGVTVDSTNREYTVSLRHDIKWQDGQSLTAKDVVFTVNTMKNPSAKVNIALYSTWKDVTVAQKDDYTVVFTLPVYAGFVHALTFPIVPAHLLASIPASNLREAGFSSSPVGSGSFMFRLLQTTDGSSGEKVVHMVANEKYYGNRPKVGRFEIHNYSTESRLAAALKASEVTAVADIDSSDAEKNTPNGYETMTYTVDDGVYLILNTRSLILKDVKVRRAIQLALDTGAVRQAAGGDVPSLGLPYIASQVSGSPSAPVQNIEQAKKLLDSAGWKQSGNVRVKGKSSLTLQMKTTKNSQFERVSHVIIAQLAAVGIQANLTTIDDKRQSTSFAQSVLQPRDYDLLLYELSMGADPDQYAYWHSSQVGQDGYNFANYSSPISDAALISARDRLDNTLRTAKYVSFAKQWLADVPAVGLYQQTVTYVHTKKSTSVYDNARYVTPSDRYFNIAEWAVLDHSVYKTP